MATSTMVMIRSNDLLLSIKSPYSEVVFLVSYFSPATNSWRHQKVPFKKIKIMNILPATQDDAAPLAMLHIEGWRASYTGLVEQAFLDGLDIGKRTQQWQEWLTAGTSALIARDGNEKPAGFIAFNKLMTPPPGMSGIRPLYTAEILALYILPAYWRQGLGRTLMSEAARILQERKHKSLCLWVLEKNARGVGFYKSLGGERCGKKSVEIGHRHLTDVCFGWRNTAGLMMPPPL